jgi:hypothetical protein
MAIEQRLPPVRRIRWQHAHRIIPSRFPPIDLFERVAPAKDWEALIALESLTNSRLRDAVGEIHLVAPEDRISGPGASYVMASFTHLNPKGSRFSDGRFGVYYAGKTFRTALYETIHHMSEFYADTQLGPHTEDMRVLVGEIDASLHDIRRSRQWAPCLDRGDYRQSRSLALRLRSLGSNGIVYPSVRDQAGECVAVFRPRCVSPPIQANHISYHWDGNAVSQYFDYGRSEWVDLPNYTRK